MLIDLKKEISSKVDQIIDGVHPIYYAKIKRKWSEMLEEDKWALEEERWARKAAEIEDKFGTIPPTGRSPKKTQRWQFQLFD